ncbi:MAG: hypothetical protein AB7O43_14180, partial [Hyphomicrobiaceae bacterium]
MALQPVDKHEPGRDMNFANFRTRLRDLYEGHTVVGHRFRYSLLCADILTVLFIVVTSFLPRTPLLEILDVAFGLFILADFTARMLISRTPAR